MKKAILLLLLLMVACAPPYESAADDVVEDLKEQAEPAVEKEVETVEETTEEPEAVEEVETEEVEETKTVVAEPKSERHVSIVPYSDLGCEGLLTAEDFASACTLGTENLSVTYRIGTNNCYVSIRDILNARLTAGVTLISYDDSEEATSEFGRRLKVYNVGADESVGERAYEFPKVDRHTINFLRNEFIVEVGSDIVLCPEESLLEVAMVVDSRLK